MRNLLSIFVVHTTGAYCRQGVEDTAFTTFFFSQLFVAVPRSRLPVSRTVPRSQRIISPAQGGAGLALRGAAPPDT